MPGLTAALASLQDVLEIKGCAISESELWSVLCLCAEALQDVLFKGNTADSMSMTKVLVTPDTVYMRPDGKISLDTLPLDLFLSSDFCAPEWRSHDGRSSVSESSLEKLWIFSLGMTLYKAADFNRNQHEDLDISPNLHAVLSDMCEENVDLRLSLTQIMQLSSSHATVNMTESFSIHVMRMYELVFGSADNVSMDVTNPSSVSSSPQMTALNDHPSIYDIRPAPVGKSVTNDDAPSRLSHSSSKQPHPVHPQLAASYSVPHHASMQQNFNLARSVEDSIKLAKLRSQTPHNSSQQLLHRHPMFSSDNRLIHGPQRSMPTLHNGGHHHIPSNSGPVGPTAPLHNMKDPHLQHAYDRLSQRRALLAAIRRSLSDENLVDPLSYLNQHHQANMADMLASTNSLNYGAFHPSQYNQENYIPREAGRRRDVERPRSAYQLQRPKSVHQVERPNSAHPILLRDDDVYDETDTVLNDPEVRRALLNSAHGDASHRSLLADISQSNAPAIHNTPRAKPKQLPQTRSRPVSANKKPGKQVKGGPEFVRLAAQPIRKLKDILPLKSQNKVPSVTVLIELLNGERLQLYCPSVTTGRQLFDVMLREVNLPEYYLFGLTHVMGGEHVFIHSDKKIEKYIPALKKKALSAKRSPTNISFTVHQRIKFYAKTLSHLKHISTRHLLYLQLRRDIVEDRLRAEERELLSLAGLALQAEYGDYDVSKHHLDYFIISYYFPPRLLKRLNQVRQTIVNKHAANSGLSTTDAEVKFIEEVIELHEYGIHFYSVCKVKDDPLSQTWIGVTSRGLALAEKRSQHRAIVQRCSWENIAKLSFNKEKFTIKQYSHSDDPSKIHRYTESYKKSKYLIWLSEEHHAFLVQMMSRGDMVHPYHQNAISSGAVVDVVPEEEVEDYEGDEISDDMYDPDMYEVEEFGEASSYQFHQGDPEATVHTNGAADYRVDMAGGTKPQAKRSNSRRQEIEVPVLEPPDHGLSPPDIEETLSDSLHERLDEVPSDSPEKRFTVVKLQRDLVSGIGVKLAAGPSGGIFVASLREGGSAHREGTVQIGDRVVAINGVSTEVTSLTNAMELIRKANNHIELIVSQPVTDVLLSSQENAQHPLSDHNLGSRVSPAHSDYNSSSDYDVSEVEGEAPQRPQTPPYKDTAPSHKPVTHVQAEKSRETLQAELEAEVAALKAEPQDSSDMMLQYQQQLAKYHPKQRAQAHPAIQLPTPPQPASLSPQSPVSPSLQTNLRQQLDEMSSEDLSTPVNVPQAKQSSFTTNIDDISSDDFDEVDEGPIVQQKYPAVSSAFRKPSIDSVPSSDVDSSVYSVPNGRPSAFASVPKATSAPKKAVRLDSTSPSESSTLSEHDSVIEPQSSLQVAVANQINDQKRAVSNQSSELTEANSEQRDTSASPQYDSEVTSEDEEISVAMTGQTKGRVKPSSSSSSQISITPGADSISSSATNTLTMNAKLRTPAEDHLSVGDNYSLTLHKINQSLGLNVTGGVNTSVKHGGIYVKSLVPKGAADNCARIHIGDRVISVNGITLTSVTHKQAVETLRSASTPVTLIMERGEPPQKPVPVVSSNEVITPEAGEDRGSSTTPIPSADKTPEPRPVSNQTPDIERLSVITQSPKMEIELTKGSSGLGFSVLGGGDPTSSDPRLSLVRVKKIFPLGAAAKSKKLQVGDVILRVNDKSVEGLSHSETVSLLRTAPSLVKLYICRPDARLLSPVPGAVTNQSLYGSNSKVSADTPKELHNSGDSKHTVITQQMVEDGTRSGQLAAGDSSGNQSASYDMNDSKSTISATSSTTMGTQESSTSRDTVQTVLKSPAVQEFEDSLKRKRGTDYGLPTPIRELDDMLRANTSTHTSRSQSPQSLSRGSSLNRSGPHMMTKEDVEVINDKLADLDISQSQGSDDNSRIDDTSSSETESDSSLTDSTSSAAEPSVDRNTPLVSEHVGHEHSEMIKEASDDGPAYPPTDSVKSLAKMYETHTDLSHAGSPVKSPKFKVEPIKSTAAEVQPIRTDIMRDSEVQPVQSIESHAVKEETVTSDVSRHSSSASSSTSVDPNRVVTVTLEKDSYGSLGFSVAGAASLGGCYIKKIIKDPALSDGTLKAGDRLLEVNGHSITKLTNPAAVMLIKNQPSTVTITVLRPLDSTDSAPRKPPRTETAVSVESSATHSEPTDMNSLQTGDAKMEEPEVVQHSTESLAAHGEVMLESEVLHQAVEDTTTTDIEVKAEEVSDTVIVTDKHIEFQKPTNATPLTSSTPMTVQEEPQTSADQLLDEEDADDFSSVEGDVPDNIDDSWSSDTETIDDNQSKELHVLLESHIGTLSLGSDLNSTLDTLDKELDEDILIESRIGTPSEVSSGEETPDEDDMGSTQEIKPSSDISRKQSLSPWADSIEISDEDTHRRRNSLTPIDLTRHDSTRSMGFATDGDKSTSPAAALSRNTSTHLSRGDSTNTHLSRNDSTNSHQSFLSTPILSRNTSLKLPPTEEMYSVSLMKPTADASLGINVLGILAGGSVFACVKALSKGGIAHTNGNIKVGHKILQINGEEIEGTSENDVQARCVNILRQCEGQVDLVLSRDRTDSYSDDLALTHDEDDLIGNSDDQLGALSDASYDRRFLGRSAPRRIFGPSVTTTDEDTDGAGDDFSQVIEHLSNDLHRSEYTDSEISVDESVTDDSSVDFDLPDESQLLETSIRLTRNDMKSPQSDDTKENSGSDTDHVVSDDDVLQSSAKYNTDEPHAEDTDTEGSMKDSYWTGDWSTAHRARSRKYDSSGIPGATADPYYDEEEDELNTEYGYTERKKHRSGDDTNSYPWTALLGKHGVEKRVKKFQERRDHESDAKHKDATPRKAPQKSPKGRRGQMVRIGKALGNTADQMESGGLSGSEPEPKESSRRPPTNTDPLEDSEDGIQGYSSVNTDEKQTEITPSLVNIPAGMDQSQSTVEQDAFSKDITMPWIQRLKLVTTPARGLYNDSSLEGVITQLLTKIANDDVYEEFRQLKSLKPVDNCEAGKLKGNKTKNRFRNVLPYDSTRVKLNSEEDYINASHIEKRLGKDTYNYIASQGPTPQTTGNFWQMVIEQGVTVIAMATQDVEGGKVKCHRYWPDSPHMPMTVSGPNGGYEVRLTKLFELQDFDIRHLEVKEVNTARAHRVIHMNYTRWPDHSMPESSIPLLQFIRVMHELYNSIESSAEGGANKGRPILVHCSAGIGRTGTLITLDIVLASIERDLKFNIHQIVTELRTQRPGMIQTKDQYLFCYTATLEALETLKKCASSTTEAPQAEQHQTDQSHTNIPPADQSQAEQTYTGQSQANDSALEQSKSSPLDVNKSEPEISQSQLSLSRSDQPKPSQSLPDQSLSYNNQDVTNVAKGSSSGRISQSQLGMTYQSGTDQSQAPSAVHSLIPKEEGS